MKSIISKFFSEGDFLLKEAKSMFFLKKEEQCDAICHSCKAVKKYLDAYEKFLFSNMKPTENYHVLLHLIIQKDSEFKQFFEKIFELKCFAEESKRDQEGFFLFADEVDEVLKNVLEIRTYILGEIGMKKEFMEEYTETSFMNT
ncbi:MAG: hypothetical protein ACERKD_04975 [Prolixibacteraceae bacterium]